LLVKKKKKKNPPVVEPGACPVSTTGY